MGQTEQYVKVEGLVEEALPGLKFRVLLDVEKEDGTRIEKRIIAHPAGKMKIHYIRVVPGDRVLVEMPNINDERGRIIRRL